ncbi:phage holin family protein [Shimia aestuarii]|uniref:4 TMS phage holin, superfamily IV n=1 Tax=Shimia aestuarii TaxID=254406 RepID=A0A1I4K7D2_9RHOB|nr:phage holin family protein [Shimia aestuarii]SFL74376.1 4 TMS phage holin, superfamily IV [Shimia aestuarii]
MPRFVISAAAHLIANAAGLLLASILLDGFSIGFLALIIVTVIFTVVLMVITPIIRKLSEKNMPSLLGGLSLITIFLGLLITQPFVDGFTIGGTANLLAATLLVWLGALIAGILVPKFLFPSLKVPKS